MAFNKATRQNFLRAPTIDYSAGDTRVSRVPPVGLLKRIILLFTGTMTITLGGGTAALGAEAPWSLVNRLRLTANGNTALFDTGGYGAMIASLFAAYGYSGVGGRPRVPDSATVPGPAATAMSAATFAAGVTAGANTWRFGWEIPLGLSDDWRDPIGLILAAAPDTVLQLEVTWGATLYSTVASRSTPILVTGAAVAALTNASIIPFIEFFTVPALEADYPDLRRIHTWQELGPQPIAAVGDQDVVMPRGNTLMRIVHNVWTNSAADGTNVSDFELRFNQNEVPIKTSRQFQAYVQRERYVRDLPDGLYAHDLWNSGTPRDAVNTLNLNDVTSRLTIGAGATIAGTSDIRTLIEQSILLTGAVAGSA
jgi:hypothetical protein